LDLKQEVAELVSQADNLSAKNNALREERANVMRGLARSQKGQDSQITKRKTIFTCVFGLMSLDG
jgi:FtsZ-binding cell division protein ZapB